MGVPTEEEYERHRMLVDGGYRSDEAAKKYVEKRDRELSNQALATGSSWFENCHPTSDMFHQFYIMNPTNEDLLYDGSEIVDEMMILVAEPERRVNLVDVLSAEQFYNAQKWNRWFRVNRLERKQTINGTFLSFLATYSDGSKIKFTMIPNHYSWLVLRESKTLTESIRRAQEEQPGLLGLNRFGPLVPLEDQR